VLLDLRHLIKEFVKNRFPHSCHLPEYGIEITEDLIPVSPAAHYIMGGIKPTSAAGRLYRGCMQQEKLPAQVSMGQTGSHGTAFWKDSSSACGPDKPHLSSPVKPAVKGPQYSIPPRSETMTRYAHAQKDDVGARRDYQVRFIPCEAP